MSKFPPRYTPEEVKANLAKMTQKEQDQGAVAIVLALMALSIPASATSPGIREIQ